MASRRHRSRALFVAAAAAVLALTGCSAPAPGASPSTTAPATTAPTGLASTQPSPTSGAARPSASGAPTHVVVVILENHSFDEVLRTSHAPYFAHLVRSGRSLTRLTAITHPSQPNYLTLFSGSTQGITDDSCPHTFSAPNLGSELRNHGHSFTGYAQGLPQPGWTGCAQGEYARKHAPWVNFANLPGSVSRPMSDFPTNYADLPTVSFVIPDLQHDMHNGTLAQADSWVQEKLSGYVTWAATHNSVLILTADEDDKSAGNVIPALIVGQGVIPGQDDHPYTTYSLLRLMEDWYGLPHLGNSATAPVITGVRS